ncbi:hypothetical protein EC912_1033 [Luteibacter rhizovicinus]|uniref:Uncharacterized protein n=1 Tax=Luteibacter rhizovicinus TaxID=242606 RepID=A0A4R3YQ39_9GAMM|nr:hypothetical protein [Luteibacter rhizovicinus]TCV94520.1 hypothetical protein EC912_1033 [Luteibacter rhizovicinus]
MKSPNYIALAASFVLAAASIAVFHESSTTAAPLTEINGTHVTDMAPIVVYADTGANVASL